jgi:hypothetical protein
LELRQSVQRGSNIQKFFASFFQKRRAFFLDLDITRDPTPADAALFDPWRSDTSAPKQ